MKYFKIEDGKKEVLPTLVDVEISVITADEWLAILSELGFTRISSETNDRLNRVASMFSHPKGDLTLLVMNDNDKFHFIPIRGLEGKWNPKMFEEAYLSPFSIHLNGDEELKDALNQLLSRLREMYQ